MTTPQKLELISIIAAKITQARVLLFEALDDFSTLLGDDYMDSRIPGPTFTDKDLQSTQEHLSNESGEVSTEEMDSESQFNESDSDDQLERETRNYLKGAQEQAHTDTIDFMKERIMEREIEKRESPDHPLHHLSRSQLTQSRADIPKRSPLVQSWVEECDRENSGIVEWSPLVAKWTKEDSGKKPRQPKIVVKPFALPTIVEEKAVSGKKRRQPIKRGARFSSGDYIGTCPMPDDCKNQ